MSARSGRTAVLYARVSTTGRGRLLAEAADGGPARVGRGRGLRSAGGGRGRRQRREPGAARPGSREGPGGRRRRLLGRRPGPGPLQQGARVTFVLRGEFEGRGTKMRALNDRGDESPEGELADAILDQLAKYERVKIAERSRRGKLRKAREGKVLRGPWPPFGFR